MRVLACYSDMNPRTRQALESHAPQAEIVYVGDDETAYWREIAKRWNGEQALVTIEQDIEITAETIPSFTACDKPWCCFWYTGPSYDVFPMLRGEAEDCPIHSLTYLRYALGCTKFSAELQRAVPHETIADSTQSWKTADVRVRCTLVEAGYEPHSHGQVEHLHQYRTSLWLKNVREGKPITFEYVDSFAALPTLEDMD